MVLISLYSDAVLVLLFISIVVVLIFVFKNAIPRRAFLIHRLYATISMLLVVWMIAVIGMRFTDPDNTTMLYVWDSITYLGVVSISVFALLIVYTFVKNWETIPACYYWLFLVPLIINIAVWTNPLHNLYYQSFSLKIDEIEFGPLAFLSSVYSSGISIISIVTLISFALKSENKVYKKQAMLFCVGIIVPMIVNLVAVSKIVPMSIAATPISFLVTIFCQGLAIYQYHFFDIKPIASQRVLDSIADGYLLVNDQELVVSYNRTFYEMFGQQYGIEESKFIYDCVKNEDVENKTRLYNLLVALEFCKSSGTSITYEQSIPMETEGSTKMLFYMVEVAPLIIDEKLYGFITMFKDVTKVKESMDQLQESQTRMMEQERLASLGQMVGGLAHNLKTPIMSISGSGAAIGNLVEECRLSIGDPDVTSEDYQEILKEADDWISKIKEACAYMSDIITAVKGQASSMSVSDGMEFSMDELFKCVALLLRHELMSSSCKLKIDNEIAEEVLLHGDINNLVQVVNNLVSNAIDAYEGMESGDVTIGLRKEGNELHILVKDNGMGVSEEVKQKLFKQMITKKGTKGTGLGIFISNSVVRGNFGGRMWVEDNPAGGAIFGIGIPLDMVVFSERNEERV
ncbi:MAG: histidine kinase N-terminal 7TM domain-containing protein [Christensenellaceae bacterium]